MKIQLPNGEKITLDEHIDLNSKIEIVEDLVREWDIAIQAHWGSNKIIFFLDGLSNYLVWHKEEEEKGLEDKDVLSIKKVEQMSGKRKSKSIPFTSLSQPQKEMLFGEVRGAENE